MTQHLQPPDENRFRAAACPTLKSVGRLPRGNGWMRQVLFVLLCCCLVAGCDIEDERDVCCQRVVIEYQYRREGQDKFKENISSLRHFLFSGSGFFVKEVPTGRQLQRLVMDSLDVADYVMVTVGNAASGTRLTAPPAGSSLEEFALQVAGADGRNADPLYYGICRFKNQQVNSEQCFVTQLSNVYCQLKVTVKWQLRPPVMTEAPIYQLRLEGCAESYELNGTRGYTMGEKLFPYSPGWNREHRIACALDGRQLRQTFTSLRYTNEQLPVLHILCREQQEYVEQTPPLDLAKAFATWKYRPSTVESQVYQIVVTIYADGRTGVKVEMETGVGDWIDGGNFG